VLTLRLSHPFSVEFDDAQVQASQHMIDRLRSLPGVLSASFTSRLPLSVTGEESSVRVQGKTYEEGTAPSAQVHDVGPDYFSVLRIPLLRGRAFEDREGPKAPRVAILNQKAVDQIFPGEDPIGKQVHLGIGWDDDEYATVVGIVGNARYTTIEDEDRPAVYIPYTQNPYWSEIIVLRTGTPPETVIPAVRRTIHEVDSQVPIYDATTMSARIGRSVSKIRFTALLLTIFAAVAFFLTAVGIYGLVAYSVANRTREIGVRVALGAESKSIVRMILAEGTLLAALGLAIGLGLAFFATRFLATFLFELSPHDPKTFVVMTLGLLLVALVATWLPARRALRVSPVEALHYE
jgi:putative ABC transport system permease protein